MALVPSAALLVPLSVGSAFAASCPTVADPQALASTAYPGQAEVEEATAAGLSLTYTENPLFAADLAAGTATGGDPLARTAAGDPAVRRMRQVWRNARGDVARRPPARQTS